MKGKLVRGILLACGMLFTATLCVPSFAASAPQASVCSSGNTTSTIEYLPSEGKCLIKNVNPRTILQAFDSSPDLTLVSATYTRDGATGQVRSATRMYTASTKIRGIYNEWVTITYSVVMKLSSRLSGGNVEEYFVEVYVDPTVALSSSSYRLSEGTSDISYEIRMNGTQLVMYQAVQLEITTTSAVDTSVSAGGWFEAGVSVGNEYIYRNRTQTITEIIKVADS